MRIAFLIFTGILLVHSSLIAQDASLREGVETRWAEQEGSPGYLNVLTVDDEFIYLFGVFPDRGAFHSAKWAFLKYKREDMTLFWKAEIVAPESNGDGLETFSAVLKSGEFWVLYKTYNKSENKHYLIERKVEENGEFGEPTHITSVDSDEDDEGYLDYHLDESGKLLTWATPQYNDREDPRKLELKNFHAPWGFLETFNKTVEFPFSYKHSRVLEVTQSESGDIYVLLMKTPEGHKGERQIDDMPNQKFLLYQIDGVSGDLRVVDLDLDRLFISKIKMLVDFNSGTTAVTGIYSEVDDEYFRGTYMILVDMENMRVEKTIVRPLEPSELIHFKKEHLTSTAGEYENYFSFSNFFRHSDGGGIVVYEYRKIPKGWRPVNPLSGFLSHPNDLANYGELFLQKITPDGQLEWSIVIPKLHYSNWIYKNDYLAINTDDGLTFVFNDHEDNHEVWRNPDLKINPLQSFRKGVVVMTTVDMSGNMDYRVLAESKVNRRNFYLHNSLLMSGNPNSLLMIYHLGFRFQLAILEITE